jgi:hypothetical protein
LEHLRRIAEKGFWASVHGKTNHEGPFQMKNPSVEYLADAVFHA